MVQYHRQADMRGLTVIVAGRLGLVQDLLDFQPFQSRQDLPFNNIADPVTDQGRADRGQDGDPAFIDARLGGENQRVRLLFTRFEILDPDNRIHGDDIPGNVLRIDHVRALQLLLQLFEMGLFLGYRCFRRIDKAGQSIHIVSRYPDFSFTHGHPLAGQYC